MSNLQDRNPRGQDQYNRDQSDRNQHDYELRREPTRNDGWATTTTEHRATPEPIHYRSRNNNTKGFLAGLICAGLFGGGLYLLGQRNQSPVQRVAEPQPVISGQPVTSGQAAPDPSSSTSTSASTTTTDSQSQSSTATQPETISSPAAGSVPAAQTLNLQVNHPNGSTARLTQLTFGEDNIVATLAVTNGHDNRIQLNSSDGMVMTDNLGNQYNLAAPPNNETISIDPGTTLKGQFAFKGRLAPGATSVALTTNNKYGGDQNYSNNPKMSFNVPLQGGAQ